MKGYGGLLVAVFAVSLAVCPAGGAVKITSDWTIVEPRGNLVSGGVGQGIRMTCATFHDVIEEALGFDLPVTAASGENIVKNGHCLYIGRVFAEKAGLLGKESGPTAMENLWDWTIAEHDGNIYFFGRDKPGARPTFCMGCVIPSALAAVEFMRKEMGVLFLMPGKVGREVPKLDKLLIPDRYRRSGSVKAPYQAGGGFQDYAYNLANAIYGSGSFHTYGGHTYPAACPREKYLETNPEYFARDRDGRPIVHPSPGCQAYCISNPEFQKMVYDELLRRYDEGADVCQLAQGDGPQGKCMCDACHRLYGTDDWGEKIWRLHVDFAKRIQKDRPGKLVHIISYTDTVAPPKSIKEFPDNVIVEICDSREDNLRKWSQRRLPNGSTFYLYNWGYYIFHGYTPKRSVSEIVAQNARLNKFGMKGLYRCGYGELYGMEGPVYWVFNRLVENPNADVAAELATYYRGAFGPAAEPMRAFYEELEKPLSEIMRILTVKTSELVETNAKRTKLRNPITCLATIYTPDRIARMDEALKAAQLTDGLSPKNRRRLQLVRTEWKYVRNVGRIAYLYEDYRDSPKKRVRDEICDLVEERNRMIEKLFPDGKVRSIDGWEELKLFGYPNLEAFRQNGRLFGRIEEPLNWNVEEKRKER